MDPVPPSKIGTHLLASLGSKGKNRNSLACLRNAGSHSAVTYCKGQSGFGKASDRSKAKEHRPYGILRGSVVGCPVSRREKARPLFEGHSRVPSLYPKRSSQAVRPGPPLGPCRINTKSKHRSPLLQEEEEEEQRSLIIDLKRHIQLTVAWSGHGSLVPRRT